MTPLSYRKISSTSYYLQDKFKCFTEYKRVCASWMSSMNPWSPHVLQHIAHSSHNTLFSYSQMSVHAHTSVHNFPHSFPKACSPGLTTTCLLVKSCHLNIIFSVKPFRASRPKWITPVFSWLLLQFIESWVHWRLGSMLWERFISRLFYRRP